MVVITLPRQTYDELLVYCADGMTVNAAVCEMVAEGMEKYAAQPLPPPKLLTDGRRACRGVWMPFELIDQLRSLSHPAVPKQNSDSVVTIFLDEGLKRRQQNLPPIIVRGEVKRGLDALQTYIAKAMTL